MSAGAPPPRDPRWPSAERWAALEPTLDAALALPPEARGAYLAAACGDDADARAQLARMLVECERDDPALDRPAAERFATLWDGREERERLAAALAGRYTIERELGTGGMATVYLARDERHARPVAVKVMRPDIAPSLGADRFVREIAFAARLHHPHIVALFDSGTADGLLWYAMPYVNGEPLRATLAREGALPLDRAVRLLREVADALDYAHEQGIVHRDVKPENILVTRGHACVADFGVAKAMAAATFDGPAGGGQLSSIGLALGTFAYMAPEQAAGRPAVDARTDLYALGMVAWELLAGAHPFASHEGPALVTAQVGVVPADVRTRRPETPAALAALVARLVEKSPDRRPQRAAEVVAALDAVGAALASPPRRSGSLLRRLFGGGT